MTRQSTRLDADTSLFFARELEQVKSAVYETEYPALKSRSLIPVATDVNPGAKSIVWQEFDRVGQAKIIQSYADDLPMADVHGTEHVGKVRGIGLAYDYSVDDVRAAQLAGRSLEARKAMATREGVELTIDQILALGDADNDLPGFLNNASVPSVNAANGGGGASAWSTKTPAEIRKDINDAIAKIIEDTLEVEAGPFDVLVPPAQYTILAQEKNSDSSDVTLLRFLLSANPYLRSITPWHRLKGIGAGATDRMMVYIRDISKVEGNVPLDFTQHEPEKRNLAYVINCEAKVAGTVFHRPLSALYVDGI